MATPADKEALVVILDVSASMAASMETAKHIASNLVQQKMIFSAKDEVGLIFAGTNGTLNRLNAAVATDYCGITVVRPIMSPNADFMKPLDAAGPEGGNADILECLVVAADLIHERTADKRYNKRIFLISNAAGIVKRKEHLGAILDGMKTKGIALVVIGMEFTTTEETATSDDDWSKFPNKSQNERVLFFACSQLGSGSVVVPVADAVEALSALRKKNIPQRTISRCMLTIGPISFAVRVFVKSLVQSFPSLHRTTAKGDFLVEKRHFSVQAPDRELDASERVKAFRYGKSFVPFSEVDEAQFKFDAQRSMQCLAFVPLEQVPMHLLMGSCKAVAPMPMDTVGAKALTAFIHGMVHLQRGMLVRYVWRENTDPVVGVCFPCAKPTNAVLYFVPLPFAEDIRHFSFSHLAGLRVSAEESAAVEEVVRTMSVDGLIEPKRTFNPANQHFYHSVRERFLHPGAPLPPLPQALKKSSCAWGEKGNVLEDALAASRPSRKRLRELFPPDSSEKSGDDSKAKVFWFAKGGAAVNSGGDPMGASPAKPKCSPETGATTTPGGSGGGSPLSYSLAITRADAPVDHVSTVDPVSSFMALIKFKGEDKVNRAIFEMGDVIVHLIRESIGEQQYRRCDECVEALRKVCVEEGEPRAFNNFLLGLMLTVRGSAHDGFWTGHIVARNILPITKRECEESDVTDEDAGAFLHEKKVVMAPALDEPPEGEDLFEQLE